VDENRKKYLLSLFRIQSHSFVRHVIQVKLIYYVINHVFAKIL